MAKKLVIIIIFLISVNLFAFSQDEEQANSSQAQEPALPQDEQMAQPSAGIDSLTPGQMQPIVPPLPNASEVPVEAYNQPNQIESIPPSEEEIESGIKVSQERISLDLKGIDIIELLRILSLKMNVTIVPTRSVVGKVNIFLNNLTFDDALDVILISQDLAADKKGNIIDIMTSTEYERLYGKKYNEKRKVKVLKLRYAKPQTVFNAIGQIKSDIGKVIVDETSGLIFLIDIPEKLELLEAAVKDLDQPLQTEIFDLKYAKPADVKTHLTSVITVGPGEVYVDERSSKVVVSDLPEKMKKIRRIVKAFDEASRQVFIEAEIVQITLKNEFQRGINWEQLFTQKHAKNLDLKGSFPVNPSFTPSPTLTNAYLKMVVGVLSSDDFTATLQLLQSFGDTKILSRPRIAALNNQEAKILVGSREAYVTQTLSQAQTTTVTSENIQFIDVGVKLNVTPTINSDGFITMKIKPEVSSVRETLTTSLGSVVPIVETSEAETVVKVKDGSMIMIAGLMKEEKRRDTVGLPILSRIPIVGNLFSSNAQQKKNTEVVVFLTPRIITGEASSPLEERVKLIPADIVPEDMEEDIIAEKLQEIKTKQPQVDPELNQFKKSNLPQITDRKLNNISEKTKGIKE